MQILKVEEIWEKLQFSVNGSGGFAVWTIKCIRCCLALQTPAFFFLVFLLN
jgi:hypothetical protein